MRCRGPRPSLDGRSPCCLCHGSRAFPGRICAVGRAPGRCKQSTGDVKAPLICHPPVISRRRVKRLLYWAGDPTQRDTCDCLRGRVLERVRQVVKRAAASGGRHADASAPPQPLHGGRPGGPVGRLGTGPVPRPPGRRARHPVLLARVEERGRHGDRRRRGGRLRVGRGRPYRGWSATTAISARCSLRSSSLRAGRSRRHFYGSPCPAGPGSPGIPKTSHRSGCAVRFPFPRSRPPRRHRNPPKTAARHSRPTGRSRGG